MTPVMAQPVGRGRYCPEEPSRRALEPVTVLTAPAARSASSSARPARAPGRPDPTRGAAPVFGGSGGGDEPGTGGGSGGVLDGADVARRSLRPREQPLVVRAEGIRRSQWALRVRQLGDR